MEIRFASNPNDVKYYDTSRLRKEFLIESLFRPDAVDLVYSQTDRIIVGSAVPATKTLSLPDGEELKSEYFLERREMGIINIGGKGIISVDGTAYELDKKDCLYISMGTKEVLFSSIDKNSPAQFYINSCSAHQSYPTVFISPDDAEHAEFGSPFTSNERVINKYIHPAGAKSCQLVMGLTEFKPGSVWNTMPCHTHDRRMEVYLYFDIAG